MHETGIALEIHRLARAATEGAASVELDTVSVAIGELSGVDPALLAFAWEAVVAGGPDVGARLDVRWCPARRRCLRCEVDHAAAADEWFPQCPDCRGPLCLEGGDELDLLQVSFLREEDVASAPHDEVLR